MIDDPEIGSSFPDAALNPLIFPERFPTKNHSFATGGGGGLMDELPPPHATARIPSHVAASVTSFDFSVCFGRTPGFASGLRVS
jgi:hypothetical protein